MAFRTSLEEIAAGEVRTVLFDDVDMLVLAWRTDPAVVARVLPPPLLPAPDPVALVFIANFKSTNYNPPYHESGLYLRCTHEGELGGWCASMLLDDDIAMMIGREMHGYPKKLARLGLELDERRAHAFIERRGIRLIDAEVVLDDAACDPIEVLSHLAGPTFTFRYAPAVEGRGMDGPVRLVRSTANAAPQSVKAGSATVQLTHSDVDPWADIAVRDMIGAALVKGAVQVPRDGGRTVATIAPDVFAPYAYAAWDRPFHNFTSHNILHAV